VGGQTPESFDQLVADLRSGSLDETVPHHGTLIRVRRSVGLEADKETIASERAATAAAQKTRAAKPAEPADAAAAQKTRAAKPAEPADAAKPADAATVSGPPPTTESAPVPTPPSSTPPKKGGGPA
jgi:hypothetical protein